MTGFWKGASVLVCMALLCACQRENPEAAVGKAFRGCVQAIESGDAPGAAKYLASGFRGPEGMQRQEAALILTGILNREKVGVTVLMERREQRGQKVYQNVEVLLTSRTGASLLPQDASRKLYQLTWEKMQGEWKMTELREG